MVKNFVFPGALIAMCGQRDYEIRRIMATGKAVMEGLTPNDRGIKQYQERHERKTDKQVERIL